MPIYVSLSNIKKPSKLISPLTSAPIQLVKAAFKLPFTEAMKQCGVSSSYYYRKVRLPSGDDDPESFLPEKPFWKLINLVAKQEGIPDFGTRVAEIRPWCKIESLAPLLQSSKTLEELLIAFCTAASGQSTHAHFELEQNNESIWFKKIDKPLIRSDSQMEMYRLTSMIQLVQVAAGSTWIPEKVRLIMQETCLEMHCKWIQNSQLVFNRGESSISIPNTLLNLPVSLKIPVTGSKLRTYDINANFLDSLRQIIRIYVGHGDCSIDTISEAVDISVRTLQRHLKNRRYKFNTLCGEVKLEMAIEYLKAGRSVSETATLLNYSDIAHFTRAFKRWTGKTPSSFRKRAKKPRRNCNQSKLTRTVS